MRRTKGKHNLVRVFLLLLLYAASKQYILLAIFENKNSWLRRLHFFIREEKNVPVNKELRYWRQIPPAFSLSFLSYINKCNFWYFLFTPKQALFKFHQTGPWMSLNSQVCVGPKRVRSVHFLSIKKGISNMLCIFIFPSLKIGFRAYTTWIWPEAGLFFF